MDLETAANVAREKDKLVYFAQGGFFELYTPVEARRLLLNDVRPHYLPEFQIVGAYAALESAGLVPVNESVPVTDETFGEIIAASMSRRVRLEAATFKPSTIKTKRKKLESSLPFKDYIDSREAEAIKEGKIVNLDDLEIDLLGNAKGAKLMAPAISGKYRTRFYHHKLPNFIFSLSSANGKANYERILELRGGRSAGNLFIYDALEGARL